MKPLGAEDPCKFMLTTMDWLAEEYPLIVSELLMFKMEVNHVCRRGHSQKVKPQQTPSVSVLKNDITIREMFKGLFKSTNISSETRCTHEKCNKKIQTEKRKILKLP